MRRSSPKYVPREWMLVEDRTFIDVVKRMMQMQYASNEHGSANAKLRLQMLARDSYVQWEWIWNAYILQCLEFFNALNVLCIASHRAKRIKAYEAAQKGSVLSRRGPTSSQNNLNLMAFFRHASEYVEPTMRNSHKCICLRHMHSCGIDMFQWHSARWFQRCARIAKSLCLAFQWACRKCSEILPEGVDVLQNSEPTFSFSKKLQESSFCF